MKPSYNEALAQLVPVFFPDFLFRLTADGQPAFPEFAAKIKPTEFAPGKVFGTGTMAPIDYMVALADGHEPLPKNLNIRFIENEVDRTLSGSISCSTPPGARRTGRRAASSKR